jgi:hypothetical protein
MGHEAQVCLKIFMEDKIMKKILFFCFYVYVVLSSCTGIPMINTNELEQTSQNDENRISTIKYDGVYIMPYSGGYAISYFRFYENGNVIDVISTGRPEQIKSWFNYDNENVGKGTYIINGNRISITTEFEGGKIDYNGIITLNGLRLNSYSHINGNESKDLIFVFKKW